MSRRYAYCSPETKLRAVQMFLEEKKSQKEIAEHFGVAVQRIKDWVWIYRRKGELGLMGRRGRPPRSNDSQAEIVRLKMENELLKNSIPSCGNLRSRSAISGDLPLPRRIRSESHVSILWSFAGGLLCLAKTVT